MDDLTQRYYEQSVWWSNDLSQHPAAKRRAEETIAVIPPDTHTILDVGCGGGIFINSLLSTYPDRFDRITALDCSEDALTHVKTEKFKGNVAKLPFEDESFDLVTCMEVLEHLDQEDYEKGVSELQRVSRKYIILTVPNNQDLVALLVMCPKCYCCFNPSFHVRSFDKNTLRKLFNKFRLTECKEIGHTRVVTSYGHLLRSLWLCYKLFYKNTPPPNIAICPQCGYQNLGGFERIKDNGNVASSSKMLALLKVLVGIFTHKRKKNSHLLALYAKK